MRSTLRSRIERADMSPGRRLRTLLATDRLLRWGGGRRIDLLDAACESGRLSLALAERAPRWRIAGVDISETMLAQARASAEGRGLGNATFAHADVTRDLPPARYDAVAALECLAEIPDTDAALRGMASSLRPGGLLVLHVPRADWEPVLRGSVTRWEREVHHGFERADLLARVRAAGLEPTAARDTMHTGVQVADELRVRFKEASLKRRVALFPVSATLVELERRGLAPGVPRGLWVEAVRK